MGSEEKLQKPASLLNKPIKANFTGLFKALSRGAIDGATFNWTGLSKDLLDTVTSLGLGTKPHELAWLLVVRAMTRAVVELYENSSTSLSLKKPNISDDFAERLEQNLAECDIYLNEEFFRQPATMPIVGKMRESICAWMEKCGAERNEAEAFASRIGTYFTCALRDEWQGTDHYEPIQASISETPFDAAYRRATLRAAYAAWLNCELERPMFDESFGLLSVYQPVRAWYTRSVGMETHSVVDLAEAMQQWIDSANASDFVRVISGGPGSGKSSFARVFAAQLAQHLPTVYVPLHRFNVKASLSESLDQFCSQSELLSPGLLDEETAEERVVLIFDGLDELAKQGTRAAEVAQDFVRYVRSEVGNRNAQRCRVQVLLIGRPIAVQQNELTIRNEEAIYHVLPYFITTQNHPKVQLEDGLGLLKTDQRDAWWRAFSELRGEGYKGLPEDLRRPDIDEITAEPLLNYLIALSHTRGKLDFSESVNLNNIYADLLDGVYERQYEGAPSTALGDLTKQSFVHLLEDVAMSAWQVAGRTTTTEQIKQHCDPNVLKTLETDIDSGVIRLLLGFFFHQAGDAGGERTYEFTHKSFGEYLTSRRIARLLARIHDEFERHDNNYDSGWEMSEGLYHWGTMCGRNIIDWDLEQFLRQELDLAVALRATARSMFVDAAQKGIPIRGEYERANDIVRFATRAEVNLLLAASHLTDPFDVGGEFGDWLRSRKVMRVSAPSLRCCAGDLQRVVLPHAFLARADLQRARLEGAGLKDAHLQEADLRAANLREADLRGANLRRADLRAAKLEGADLEGVDLEGADLKGAGLQRAKLEGADLEGADLRGADLREADLRGSADLRGARLRDADLVRADLGQANLQRADLQGADLQMADLRGADLQRADLEGADLDEAKLQGAKMAGATSPT